MQLTCSGVSRNPVALCDGHGALLVADGGSLVAAHTGRRGGAAQDRTADGSGMLTEPCRGVFMQSGRWIFIHRHTRGLQEAMALSAVRNPAGWDWLTQGSTIPAS